MAVNNKIKVIISYIILVIFSFSLIIPIIVTPYMWLCVVITLQEGELFLPLRIYALNFCFFTSIAVLYAVPLVLTIIQKKIRTDFFKVQLLFVSVLVSVIIVPLPLLYLCGLK